ncbi:hypothetical protein QFC22_003332 [Naganishia vaughanmartiniae]|uniref:Uncharacterized protein n=1 Tax=Naganishia vaughanmartiniae TaxID=1424756 RepID=A0ACC2X757_9TREE|nr:hypothetical protein QFC22_003332 [Naganishia vaughanmartiniae]
MSKPTNSEIFTSPAPGCGPKREITYTPEQEALIDELYRYALTLLLPESDPYHVWEKRFVTDPGCCPRYMRAAKWKLDNAKERIKGTLEWRRNYKPELIQESDVSPEAETGKMWVVILLHLERHHLKIMTNADSIALAFSILNGFDIDGRPILYLRPGRENQKTSPRQIRHLIFHLERAIDFMTPGVETVMIIVDYASATSQSNPSITTARQVLNILQNHYVERMGRAIVVNMPWWVNAFFTAITPFLDPVTKEKMRFNPKLPELVPVSQLDAEFGGENNFKFDHPIYWKTLVEFCHLAPDGGRLDKNGQHCIPPAGNGARAAFENGGGSTITTPASGQPPANQTGASDASDVETSANASHSGLAAAGAVTASEERALNNEGLNSSLQGLSVHDKAERPANPVVSNLTDDSRSTNSFESAHERLPMEEVPAVPTAQGPPAGAVVFDHPPTEAERLQAEALVSASQ